MRKPYLIQRCTYTGQGKKIGDEVVSDFYRQDYMGSSEFEFGELPASLRRMYQHLDFYNKVGEREIKGKTVYFWGDSKDFDEYAKFLEQLKPYEDLKEVISFTDYFEEKKNFAYLHDDFWWDIVNDIVFSFNKEAVEKFGICLLNSIDYMDKMKEKK